MAVRALLALVFLLGLAVCQPNVRPSDSPNTIAGAAFIDVIETIDTCAGCPVYVDPILSAHVVTARINGGYLTGSRDSGFEVHAVGGVYFKSNTNAEVTVPHGDLTIDADVSGDILFFGGNVTFNSHEVEVDVSDNIRLDSNGDINFDAPGGVGTLGDLKISSQFSSELYGVHGISMISNERHFQITAAATTFLQANDIYVAGGDPIENDTVFVQSNTKIEQIVGQVFDANSNVDFNIAGSSGIVFRSPVNDVDVESQLLTTFNSLGNIEFQSVNDFLFESYSSITLGSDTVGSFAGYSVAIKSDEDANIISDEGVIDVVARGQVQFQDGGSLGDAVLFQGGSFRASAPNDVASFIASDFLTVATTDKINGFFNSVSDGVVNIQADLETGSIRAAASTGAVNLNGNHHNLFNGKNSLKISGNAVSFNANGNIFFDVGCEDVSSGISTFSSNSINVNVGAFRVLSFNDFTINSNAQDFTLNGGNIFFDAHSYTQIGAPTKVADITFDAARDGTTSLSFVQSLSASQFVGFEFSTSIHVDSYYRTLARSSKDVKATSATGFNFLAAGDTYLFTENNFQVNNNGGVGSDIAFHNEYSDDSYAKFIADSPTGAIITTTNNFLLQGGDVRLYSDYKPIPQSIKATAGGQFLSSSADQTFITSSKHLQLASTTKSSNWKSYSHYLRAQNNDNGYMRFIATTSALFDAENFHVKSRGPINVFSTDLSITAAKKLRFEAQQSDGNLIATRAGTNGLYLNVGTSALFQGGAIDFRAVTGNLRVSSGSDIFVYSGNERDTYLVVKANTNSNPTNAYFTGHGVSYNAQRKMYLKSPNIVINSFGVNGYDRDVNLVSGNNWDFLDGNAIFTSDNLRTNSTKQTRFTTQSNLDIASNFDMQFISGDDISVSANSTMFRSGATLRILGDFGDVDYSATTKMTTKNTGPGVVGSCRGTSVVGADFVNYHTPKDVIFDYSFNPCNVTGQNATALHINVNARRGKMTMWNKYVRDNKYERDRFDITGSTLVEFIGGELSWHSLKQWINMTSPNSVDFKSLNLEDNSQLPIGRDNKIYAYKGRILTKAAQSIQINTHGVDPTFVDQDIGMLFDTGIFNTETIELFAKDAAMHHDASFGIRLATGDFQPGTNLNRQLQVLATRDIQFDASASIGAFAGSSTVIKINNPPQDISAGIAFIAETGSILARSEHGTVTYRAHTLVDLDALNADVTMTSFSETVHRADGDTNGSIRYRAPNGFINMTSGDTFTIESGTDSYNGDTLFTAFDVIDVHSGDEQRYRVTSVGGSKVANSQSNSKTQYGFEFVSDNGNMLVQADDGTIISEISGDTFVDAEEGSLYHFANTNIFITSTGGRANFAVGHQVYAQSTVMDVVFRAHGDCGSVEITANSGMDLIANALNGPINLNSNSSSHFDAAHSIDVVATKNDIKIRNDGEDQDFLVHSGGSIDFNALGGKNGDGIKFEGQNYLADAKSDFLVSGSYIEIGRASEMGSRETRPNLVINAGGDNEAHTPGVVFDTQSSNDDIKFQTLKRSFFDTLAFTTTINTNSDFAGTIQGPVYFNNTVADGVKTDQDPDAYFNVQAQGGILNIDGQSAVTFTARDSANFQAVQQVLAQTEGDMGLFAGRSMIQKASRLVDWQATRSQFRTSYTNITVLNGPLSISSTTGDGADFVFDSDYTFDFIADNQIRTTTSGSSATLNFETDGDEANLIVRAYADSDIADISINSHGELEGAGRVVAVTGEVGASFTAQGRISLLASDRIDVIANNTLSVIGNEGEFRVTSGYPTPRGDSPMTLSAEGQFFISSATGHDISFISSSSGGSLNRGDTKITTLGNAVFSQKGVKGNFAVHSSQDLDVSSRHDTTFISGGQFTEDVQGWADNVAGDGINFQATASKADIIMLAQKGQVISNAGFELKFTSGDVGVFAPVIFTAKNGVNIQVQGADSDLGFNIISGQDFLAEALKGTINIQGNHGVQVRQTNGPNPLVVQADGKDPTTGESIVVKTTHLHGDILFEALQGTVTFEGSSSVQLTATTRYNGKNQGFIHVESFNQQPGATGLTVNSAGPGTDINVKATGNIQMTSEKRVRIETVNTQLPGDIQLEAQRAFEFTSVGNNNNPGVFGSAGIVLEANDLVQFNSASRILLDSQAGGVYFTSRKQFQIEGEGLDFAANNALEIASSLKSLPTDLFESQIGIDVQAPVVNLNSISDSITISSGFDTSLYASNGNILIGGSAFGSSVTYNTPKGADIRIAAKNSLDWVTESDYNLFTGQKLSVSAIGTVPISPFGNFPLPFSSGIGLYISGTETVSVVTETGNFNDIFLISKRGSTTLYGAEGVTISGRASANGLAGANPVAPQSIDLLSRGFVDFQPTGANDQPRIRIFTEFMRIPVIRREAATDTSRTLPFIGLVDQDLEPRVEDFQKGCTARQIAYDTFSTNFCICIAGRWACASSN